MVPDCSLSQLPSRPAPSPPRCYYESPFSLHNSSGLPSVPSEYREDCAAFCFHWAHQVAREHVTASFPGSGSFSWHGDITLCSWVMGREVL